jgi:hypothetical protein
MSSMRRVLVVCYIHDYCVLAALVFAWCDREGRLTFPRGPKSGELAEAKARLKFLPGKFEAAGPFDVCGNRNDIAQ